MHLNQRSLRARRGEGGSEFEKSNGLSPETSALVFQFGLILLKSDSFHIHLYFKVLKKLVGNPKDCMHL